VATDLHIEGNGIHLLQTVWSTETGQVFITVYWKCVSVFKHDQSGRSEILSFKTETRSKGLSSKDQEVLSPCQFEILFLLLYITLCIHFISFKRRVKSYNYFHIGLLYNGEIL